MLLDQKKNETTFNPQQTPLFGEAIKNFGPTEMAWLIRDLINVSILALGNRDFQSDSMEDNSAIAGTLTLAKSLIPDEFAFERAFGD
jgi:hypothetical protein